METNFNHTKYTSFIKVVHMILLWLIVILFIGLGAMAVGALIMLFIPRGLLDVDMASLSEINTRLTAIIREIDPGFFTGTVNVKRSIIALLLSGIAHAAFIQFIMIMLRKLIGNVKDHTPFRQNNAVILRNLGIGFLVASLVLPVFSSLSMLTVARMFDIFDQFQYRFSIQWSHVFMGVLILILAYVFSYGAYLQEEHDATV